MKLAIHNIMNYFILVVTLLSLFNCSNTEILDEYEIKKGSYSEALNKSRKVFFRDTSSDEILRILNIKTIDKSREIKRKFSGFYHLAMNKENEEILHGKFFFKHLLELSDLDKTTIDKEIYYGEFKHNQIIETITKIHYYNDSVDFYEDWRVDIKFDKNEKKCISGVFKGSIGYAMPKTIYTELNPKICSFNFIVEKAWNKWGEQFSK